VTSPGNLSLSAWPQPSPPDALNAAEGNRVAQDGNSASAAHLLGMVPQRTDVEARTVRLVRAGNTRFTHPFYDFTVSGIVRSPSSMREIGFAELRHAIAGQQPSPCGVVVHTGRCGSTLLTRMLGHDRSILVVSEPSPIAALIMDAQRHADRAVEDEQTFCDELVLLDRFAEARRQRPLVKLPSWLATDVARVTRLLPDAPFVFVHRPALDVVASELAARPAWLDAVVAEVAAGQARMPGLGRVDSGATEPEILAALWAAAVDACLALPAHRLCVVEYDDLVARPAEVLATVMAHLGLPPARNPASVEAELQYYAKSPNPTERFEPGARHSRPALSADASERVTALVGDAAARLAARRAESADGRS
jgi:Sulfotransferase family